VNQPDPGPDLAPDSETLRRALKAFRKRLKVMRLDEESKLGGRRLTGGRRSGIVAITPPREFPPEVWQELVRQGRLRSAGSGLYELVDGPG
jgi:hypothetical protein